jgi:formyl-CoA transferase
VRKEDFYRDARTDLPGPLASVRVLEVGTTWAGPMCGCILADLGADVVKVEPPSGDVARVLPPFLPGTGGPISFAHATVNRNKRCVAVDLRRPAGRDLFLRLATDSDIVIENLRPGAMERLGLGYADVRGVRGNIVYVSISGWGQFGPDHDRAGYDPLAQAAAGWLAQNGEPEGLPTKSPTFLSDDLAGLHASVTALAALRHRDQTGEGQHVDVSLLDSLLFQSNGFLTLGAMDVDLPRMGNRFVVAAPANVYPARDGYVMTGVLLDRHWRILAGVLGRDDLAEDPGYATAAARIARRTEVDGMLGAWVAQRSVRDIMDELHSVGLAAAEVRTYGQTARDPHVLERDMLQPTRLEEGTVAPITGPAAKLSRTPTRVRTGAPALGEHTREILTEAGIPTDEQEDLHRQGIIHLS